MLKQLIEALRTRSDVRGWSVRHVVQRGAQLYAVPAGVEAQRAVEVEKFSMGVLVDTGTADQPACGFASMTVLPGDDVSGAIDEAVLMASLVHNPPYDLPAPAPLPDVPLSDDALHDDPVGALAQLYARVQRSAARHPAVKLTAVEAFADETTTHLINSRGIDATQTGTKVAVEWVLIGRENGREVESFFETTCRRVIDLDIEAEMDRRAQYTHDLLCAAPAPDYAGAVVLRGEMLAGFFHGSRSLGSNVFAVLGAASEKYSKISPWEVGGPVTAREVNGDALTLWANRALPYGVQSNRFDEEGLPAQRVELIRDLKVQAFVADQRHAAYLALPPTGGFGDFEVAPGTRPEAELCATPHVEIAAFSWFNPNPANGTFSCEIRLGYLVEGEKRTPFRGGVLIGNVLEALADVHFSRETIFTGDYLGPRTARFAALRVAGHTA